METLTLTVPEAGKVLGLSRNGAYDAVTRGEIPVIRFGRRMVVPKVALERMLESAGQKPRESEAA
jgi:excisionase family DNA binding protein